MMQFFRFDYHSRDTFFPATNINHSLRISSIDLLLKEQGICVKRTVITRKMLISQTADNHCSFERSKSARISRRGMIIIN